MIFSKQWRQFLKRLTLKASLRLPEITTNLLSSTGQNENCEKEYRILCLIQRYHQQLIVDEKIERADGLNWWFKLKGKYPLLSKISLALLSIFHGP